MSVLVEQARMQKIGSAGRNLKEAGVRTPKLATASAKWSEIDMNAPPKRVWYKRRPSVAGCGRLFKLMYRKLGIKHCIPALIIVAYTISGGLMFYALEHSHDSTQRSEMARKLTHVRSETVLNLIEASFRLFSPEANSKNHSNLVTSIFEIVMRPHTEPNAPSEGQPKIHKPLYNNKPLNITHKIHNTSYVNKSFGKENINYDPTVTKSEYLNKIRQLIEAQRSNKLNEPRLKRSLPAFFPIDQTLLAPNRDRESLKLKRRLESDKVFMTYHKILTEFERQKADITGLTFEEQSIWDIWSSMYFCGTLYTTIGYGNIACTTTAGQVITLLYALIGIPLVLTAMNDLGKFIFLTINKFLGYFTRLSTFTKRCKKAITASIHGAIEAWREKRKLRRDAMEQSNRDKMKESLLSSSEDRSSDRSRRHFLGIGISKVGVASVPSIIREFSFDTSVPESIGSRFMDLSPDSGISAHLQDTHQQPSPLQQQSSRQAQFHISRESEENFRNSEHELFFRLARCEEELTSSIETTSPQDIEKGADGEEKDENEEGSEYEDDHHVPIPVSVALFVTIGWIFLCAATFCIWETEWSYFTSIYFFVISLSTIGLGDVVPAHPKFMIIMFGLVIIGLSLVSMCITVVQANIEDLYFKLLMKLLADYQKRMAKGGGDEVGATMQMMDDFNNNTAAKLLKLLP